MEILKNKGLRKEWAALLALGALVAFKKNKKLSAIMATSAAGLVLANQRSSPSFHSQSILITGGSRGLGLALAIELAREGARLSLIARDRAELERARAHILSLYPQTQILLLTNDITEVAELREAVEKTAAAYGGIDMLINNAGSITVGPYADMTRADFEAQMELHFYAVMNAVNLTLPHLRRSPGRRILNICSMGGKVAVPHMLPYDVSKFALSGYSQGLMAELSPENITVTTIYPALMRTGSPIQAVFKGDHEKEYAWFATSDVLPGLSSDPFWIARKALDCARERRTEWIPSLPGKIRSLAAALFPETVASVMKLMASSLPTGHSRIRKTGFQSREFFEKSPITSLAKRPSRQAEADFNQWPKDDAEYNMGLKH